MLTVSNTANNLLGSRGRFEPGVPLQIPWVLPEVVDREMVLPRPRDRRASRRQCRRREFGAPLVPPRGCMGSDGRTSLTLPLATPRASWPTWRRKQGPQLAAEIPGGNWRGVRDSKGAGKTQGRAASHSLAAFLQGNPTLSVRPPFLPLSLARVDRSNVARLPEQTMALLLEEAVRRWAEGRSPR